MLPPRLPGGLPAALLLPALLLPLALAPGCARKRAQTHTPGAGATVLSAAAIDLQDGSVDSAGDAVVLAIRHSVYSRGFELRELPHEVIATRFPSLPEPEQRLTQLTTFGRDAAFILLVEARAQYQAPSGARYRWLVHSRVSGDRPDVEGAPLVIAIDIPVLIPLPGGRREKEAVSAAAPAIGGQVASLLDSLLVEP